MTEALKDPKVLLNILAAFLVFTVSDQADITAVFGDKAAAIVTHVCGYLAGLIMAGNAVMHGTAPSAPATRFEEARPSQSPAVPPINKLVTIFALILIGSAIATPALAQTQTPRPRPAPASPAAHVDPLSKLMSDIANVKQEIVAGVIADIQAADNDASTVDPQSNQMRDPIAHACYPAQIKFLQQLPTAAPLQGKYVAVQLHQRLRDFILQIKAGLPTYLKLGCAPMIGDDLQVVVQTLGLVGVTVTSSIFTGGLAPLALPAIPPLIP